MSTRPQIAPTDFRDYLKGKGWNLVSEAIKDRLYVLNHSRFPNRQLVFPMDASASDYFESVMLATEKLASLDGIPVEAVFSNLHDLRSDSIRFRLYSDREFNGSLPLPFASAALASAQKSLMASACSVLKPRTHHPRLGFTEAQQLVDAAQFRHTEVGSFVLKVTCPMDSVDVSAPLMPEEVEAPFPRRTVLTLRRALEQMVASIENDSMQELVDRAKADPFSPLSSNLCEAISGFYDEGLKNALDVSFSWSSLVALPAGDSKTETIRIQRDYFSRIEEIRRHLRPVERLQEDMFIGTVEVLNGEMGEDGRRAGEAILALQLSEGEIVRARINLSAEDYSKADKAHMTEGTYVKIIGNLHPGRQPRTLTGITLFELICEP